MDASLEWIDPATRKYTRKKRWVGASPSQLNKKTATHSDRLTLSLPE
jgi:hypothetical protein